MGFREHIGDKDIIAGGLFIWSKFSSVSGSARVGNLGWKDWVSRLVRLRFAFLLSFNPLLLEP